MSSLIEEIAQVIYENSSGLTAEEYEQVFGVKPKFWKTDAPWDSRDDELAEHERDDYRWMARQVLEYLQVKDLLKKQ
jgi:hypothetical protein